MGQVPFDLEADPRLGLLPVHGDRRGQGFYSDLLGREAGIAHLVGRERFCRFRNVRHFPLPQLALHALGMEGPRDPR